MTDVAYRCHNCGSMHEVESIRENLILNLRAAASYKLSGQHGILDHRARFLRWRMTQGLVKALWPGYSHHPRPARGRRLLQGPPAHVSDRPVPYQTATSGSAGPAADPAIAGARDQLAGMGLYRAPPPQP